MLIIQTDGNFGVNHLALLLYGQYDLVDKLALL